MSKASDYNGRGDEPPYRTELDELEDEMQELRDDLLNEQACSESLVSFLKGIGDIRNEFKGPNLDYMQGYRDGQQFLQKLIKEQIG